MSSLFSAVCLHKNSLSLTLYTRSLSGPVYLSSIEWKREHIEQILMDNYNVKLTMMSYNRNAYTNFSSHSMCADSIHFSELRFVFIFAD